MELIGVEDVMRLCGVGRPTATRILQDKNCPTLPRKVRQPYLVEKTAFEEYLKNGGYSNY